MLGYIKGPLTALLYRGSAAILKSYRSLSKTVIAHEEKLKLAYKALYRDPSYTTVGRVIEITTEIQVIRDQLKVLEEAMRRLLIPF